MTTVNTEQAQQDFAGLLARVKSGETVVIEEDGHPVVQLTPVSAPEKLGKRTIGWLAGKYKIPDDIKTPFEDEINQMFYGE